jgi:hypothetical protein
MKASCYEAVDPVRGPKYSEKPCRFSAMIRPKEQPEKDRQRREANKSDGVWPRHPPCVNLIARHHESSVLLRDGDRLV